MFINYFFKVYLWVRFIQSVSLIITECTRALTNARERFRREQWFLYLHDNRRVFAKSPELNYLHVASGLRADVLIHMPRDRSFVFFASAVFEGPA